MVASGGPTSNWTPLMAASFGPTLRQPGGRSCSSGFPRLAPVLLATSRRSRWSARSEARTYDLDLRGAPAIIERRGSPGWGQIKAPADSEVGPQQAATPVPKLAAVASHLGL